MADFYSGHRGQRGIAGLRLDPALDDRQYKKGKRH
jgi:hypothetical protein